MATVSPHNASELPADSSGRAAGAHAPRPPSTYRLTRPAGTGYAVQGFARDCLYRLIDFPELPLRMGTREIIKADEGTLLVRAELAVGGRLLSVAYKRIERRGWVKRLADLFRTNRTVRTWQLGHELIERGIATARPLAAVVPRLTDSARLSYFATEWLDDTCAVDVFCHNAARLDSDERDRTLRRATDSLARLIGDMHRRQVSHRDLKVANLLLRQRGKRVEAFVVDLDGAAVHRSLSPTRRRRNLARLIVSVAHLSHLGRSLRLRFLKTYLRTIAESDAGWKDEWRALTQCSTALARRKQRRSRRDAKGSPS